ncbi:hypothetical protein B4U37_08915 [Sutcliffiella horikoshii]|uniref:Short-chain dehydrogenase n=2 Tax=Sutcliffiella horikoshii TaxID=79883 RepID=A0A1Y0CLV9_9BACI|nr:MULTISPECIES: hypothetical protein [Bacillaceae]ART76152.1 hypothetical protein B4U37_08915 [Sutcliffiella horikoshii]TYS68571.1 hypothetical protein FZC75_17930 [Sutcliffiella horikoshii]
MLGEVIEMGSFDFILLIVALLILAGGMIYTYKVGRQSSTQSANQDSSIDEKVQDHYVLRNPVFLTYLIAAVLVLSYIVYAGLNSNW